MFEIRKTMHIPLPPQAVFNAARQVEKFPEVLPNLDSARVVSDEGNGRLITEWTATLKVGPMSKKVTWTERDSWNEADLSCRFELVKGDMKIYNGDWKFEAQDGGERSSSSPRSVRAVIRIPVCLRSLPLRDHRRGAYGSVDSRSRNFAFT